jgi:hypothetical protein
VSIDESSGAMENIMSLPASPQPYTSITDNNHPSGHPIYYVELIDIFSINRWAGFDVVAADFVQCSGR